MPNKVCKFYPNCKRADCPYLHPPRNNNVSVQQQQPNRGRNVTHHNANAGAAAFFGGQNSNTTGSNTFFQQNTTSSIFGTPNNHLQTPQQNSNRRVAFASPVSTSTFSDNNNTSFSSFANRNTNGAQSNVGNSGLSAFNSAVASAASTNLFAQSFQTPPSAVAAASLFGNSNSNDDDGFATMDEDHAKSARGSTVSMVQSAALSGGNVYAFSCYGTSDTATELPGDISPEEWRIMCMQAAQEGRTAELVSINASSWLEWFCSLRMHQRRQQLRKRYSSAWSLRVRTRLLPQSRHCSLCKTTVLSMLSVRQDRLVRACQQLVQQH
jgi:hypothetical protein